MILDKSRCLQATRAWTMRKWCAMFKQTCHSQSVITNQNSIECQKVMCHVQTDMPHTSCDYKTKEHGMSERDVPCSNRHVTYILWLQNKRVSNVRKWYAMFKQTCHLPTVITNKRAWNVRKWCAMFKQIYPWPAVLTKQKSMECQKVMCHVQTDMSLTSCDYKTKEHGMSETDVPFWNRHMTYPLWLQNNEAWKVRKWCAMFKQTCHLLPVITK
jgi:hypothetical protein